MISSKQDKAEKRIPQAWQPFNKSLVVPKSRSIQDISLFMKDDSPLDILHQLKDSVPIPVTLINTRDCFVHDLIVKESILNLGKGRE